MVINPFKAFLFIAGGATAAVATAYVSGALDPYLYAPRTATLAALPEPTLQSEPASPKGERLPQPAPLDSAKAPAAAAPAEPAPAPGTTADAAGTASAAVIAPSFDIVRAEPDGSIVVAGKAAPGAAVEIVAGTQTLGTTKAGADGDFAIVLDEPLKPGGHELVLRSTTEDKVVATSPETAVVSIPDQKDGQVLALVEKPGQPSKLITVPEPTAPKPVRPEEPATETNAPATAAGQPAQPGEPATAQDETKPTGEEAVAAATLEQPETSSPAPAGQDAAPAKPEAAGEPKEPEAATQTEKGAAEPKVAVDAVEIEGRKVFVAGAADPGRRVRVYANDILLGEALASPGGRFLIEAERDLPVGDYIVRADALEPGTGKVVARAAVPFEREPGEAVSAVAQATEPKPVGPAAGAPPADAPPEPAADQPAAAEAPPATQQAGRAATPDQPGMTPAPGTQVAAGEPAATAPKLQNVDGAVIIRRGDTLWRISRRVYGRGVRYSTIYLANQDQIADPDRIWPGQVFSVPEKTPEGDAADMTTMKDQATQAPKAPL